MANRAGGAKEDHSVQNWQLMLLAAAMLGFVPSPAPAEDRVVAQVNGVDIKNSDLDFAATEVGPQLSAFPPEQRRMMLLQFVIENELMAGAAVKDGLDSGQSFEDRLKYHRRRSLRDAYYDKTVRGGVSDAEAKKVYDEKVGGLKPEEEIHARHILVKTEQEAKDIAERLKKGEDFAALAKEKSQDAGAEGGDLGFFTRGQMIKPFEEAAFKLEVGKISDPVQTQFGWHVIKVEEKRTRPLPSFDEVKETIYNQLTQQKATQTLRDLQGAAKIEIVDPDIKKSMEDLGPKREAPPQSGTEPPGGAQQKP
jgi:peptidyl-prolyl cis-trans isomerase C